MDFAQGPAALVLKAHPLQVALAVFFGSAVILILYLVKLQRNPKALALKGIPGPMPLLLFGNTLQLMTHPWRVFFDWSQKYGKIYKMFMWSEPFLVVSDVPTLKSILLTNIKAYQKDPWSYRIWKGLLGNGLVSSDGELWKRQRLLIAPTFQFDGLGRLTTLFAQATEKIIDNWTPKDKTKENGGYLDVDVAHEFKVLTLDIMIQALVGEDYGYSAELINLFLGLMHEMNLRIFFPFRQHLPLPATFICNRGIRRLDEIIFSVIQKRKKEIASESKDSYVDFLSVWVKDGKMDDRQLCDEIKTMLLAGHESSGLTLAYCLYSLAMLPHIYQKVLDEIDPIMKGKTVPTFEDIKQMTYTQQVLHETLRYYSVVPAVIRETIDEVQMGKITVPKQTKVILSLWSTHHDESLWPKPYEFLPERFSEKESMTRDLYAYLPFTQGPRVCVGMNFALVEAKLVLAMILSRFTVTVTPGYELEEDGHVVPIAPKKGLVLRMGKRVQTKEVEGVSFGLQGMNLSKMEGGP